MVPRFGTLFIYRQWTCRRISANPTKICQKPWGAFGF